VFKERRRLFWGLGTAALVLAAAIACVAFSDMRPAYDAYGWLDWGRQLLHWNLNTNGAPSWKPLPFLFTVPYALAGQHIQMWLWMVTAMAGTLAGGVFAARIAFRLTREGTTRVWVPFIAGAIAGIGVLGMDNYPQLVLIANSDPMIATLCLAAIDAHLSGHRRLAFALLVLASLGRPEVWAFAGGYGIYLWRARPGVKARLFIAVGLFVIPLLWFGVPALTAKSWFISGDLALNSRNLIHGSKIVGVLNRLLGLYSLPMQLAAGLSMVLAAVRRDRTVLVLTGLAWLWVAIEIAFAYHGWSAVPRYLIEPAAVMVVIAAVGVGRVLSLEPSLRWLRALVAVPVAALLVALVPFASARVRDTHAELIVDRHDAKLQRRLDELIKRLGARRIRDCGQPVTVVGFQSELAWEIGMNVGYVGYKPGKSIHKGMPIVYFKPHGYGWEVRPIHLRASDRAACAALKTETSFS
jgi:hypothetical protein